MDIVRSSKRADIRKCAIIAALVAVAFIAVVEIAGSALTSTYAGVGQTLVPAAGSPAHTIPAAAAAR